MPTAHRARRVGTAAPPAWRRGAAVLCLFAAIGALLAGCDAPAARRQAEGPVPPRHRAGGAATATASGKASPAGARRTGRGGGRRTSAPAPAASASGTATTSPGTAGTGSLVPLTRAPVTAPAGQASPAGVPTTSTTPPLPPAGAGLVAGEVTAIGDSVLLDYAGDLRQDLAGLQLEVEAAVGRQFSEGLALARQLRAEDALGAIVVVALGTNGTVSPADAAAMAAALSGASRIVFVTVHVDESWQEPDNAVLRQLARTTPHAVLADWAALAASHPSWFYADGTHLPIGGPGAQALAELVAGAVRGGAPG